MSDCGGGGDCKIEESPSRPTLPAPAWHSHTGQVNSLAGTVWITGTSDWGQPVVTQLGFPLSSEMEKREEEGRERERPGRRGEREEKEALSSSFYVHTGRPSLPSKLQYVSSILVPPWTSLISHIFSLTWTISKFYLVHINFLVSFVKLIHFCPR